MKNQLPAPAAARSIDDKWRDCFDGFMNMNFETRQLIRRNVGAQSGQCGEIGSSDLNHMIFGVWERNGGDWTAVILDLVNNA